MNQDTQNGWLRGWSQLAIGFTLSIAADCSNAQETAMGDEAQRPSIQETWAVRTMDDAIKDGASQLGLPEAVASDGKASLVVAEGDETPFLGACPVRS